jgi:alkanesulfonate monooxygenase SsuD/methylene tetrahydromethanopterin reductase-like flavin-dependent oxidoreductase (luciferase family)
VHLPAGGEGPPPQDFDACVALARTAERGLFDFLLLTGGARPAACDGRKDGEPGGPGGQGGWAGPDGCGPEPVTVLHALAAVTTRIGLAVAVGADAAGREPYDLARRIAALDRLSGGRAGGPPGRPGGHQGPHGWPVTFDFGGAAEVLLTGPAAAGRPGSRRARVMSRLDLADGAAESGARALADRLHEQVQSAVTDGFVLRSESGAAGRGLDAFVDRVVPLLQERGSLRTAYAGTTLRDHLGLPRPVG